MHEAPRGNPYAPTSATVVDTGPPSRLLLTFAVILHGFWCACSALIVLGLLAFEAARGRLLPAAVFAFTILYGYTIAQLFRRRRWAWWACWLPIIAMLLLGALLIVGLVYTLSKGRDFVQLLPTLVAVLGSALALVPLQWLSRREL